MRPKKKIAIAAGLVVALSSGVYYAKEHTKLFWRNSDPEYLVPFEEAVASSGARIREWLKEAANKSVDIPNSRVCKRTLTELIVDRGYVAWKANTDLDLADILVFGDFHRGKDKAQASILNRLVRRDDLVLVEGSPEEVGDSGKLDLRELAPKVPILIKVDPMADVFSQYAALQSNVNAVKEGYDTTQKRMELMQDHSPERGSNLSFLVGHAKGIVIGVDAQLSLKHQFMYVAVQQLILACTRERLENGTQLHEFQNWLVYDDLALCARGEDAVSAIKRYEAGIPDRIRRIRESRQTAIIDNVIGQLDNKSTNQRAVLILGDAHVRDQSFVDRLERERRRYIIFRPDLERLEKDHTIPTARDDDSIKQKNRSYVESHILPRYVRERVKAGRPPYTGSTTGIFR